MPSFHITIGKGGLYFLTRFLKYLFRRLAIAFLLPLILLAHIATYLPLINSPIFEATHDITFNGYVILLFMVLLSLILHELGHLAACDYLRCDHHGFQFYLPNVLKSWAVKINNIGALNPQQRVLMDLSGIWFQLLFFSFLFIFYLISGSGLFLLMMFLVDIQLIWVLIPDHASDGFWMITDLCDVLKGDSSEKRVMNQFLSAREAHSLDEHVYSVGMANRWKIQGLIIGLCAVLLAGSVLLFIIGVELNISIMRGNITKLHGLGNSKELWGTVSSLCVIFFWVLVLVALLLCFGRLIKFGVAFWGPKQRA